VSDEGTVSVKQAYEVFYKMNFANREMYESWKSLEESFGVPALEKNDLFKKALPNLLKSFCVNVGSVPDDEEPVEMNYLAFAFGVWMEDPNARD